MHTTFFRAVLLLLVSAGGLGPLAAHAGMNLRVDSVSIVGNPANAGGTTQFVATVTNTGDQLTAAFVMVYLSADAQITEYDDQMLTFASSPLLNPGQSATVTQTVTLPSKMASGDYFLGTFLKGWYDDVDPRDNVGSAGIAVIGAHCAPDAYEQDDTRAGARPMAVNTIETHNFCDDPDDWVSFQAVAGTRYGIQTKKIGYAITWLTLAVYGADGTLLAGTPIDQGTDNPKLIWTAPDSGTYYVRSRPSSRWYNTGVGTEYSYVIADVLPDLLMSYSSSDAIQGVAGGTGWFYTAVSNFGFGDSGPFDVGVYLSTDPVVTRDDMRIGWRSVAGLAANGYSDIANVLIAFPGSLPGGTYYAAAIADDTDKVAEYEENNNASGVVSALISGPSCAPDAYEDDDLQPMARPIALNEQQTRNFCEDTLDWSYFDADAGHTYYPRALYPAPYPGGPTGAVGSVEVYDANGMLLAKGSGVVGYTAPQAGRYYVLVRGGLSANDYNFALLDQQPDLVATTQYAMDTGGVPRGGVIDDASFTARNVGFVDAPASLLGFYFSTDNGITLADTLLHTVALAPIAPGGQASQSWVRVPVSSAQPAGTYWFGVLADAGNTVVEFDEANNGNAVRPIEVTAPACPPDAYDDDDLPGQAKALALNQTQSRNFCEDGYDWVTADLQGGMTYAFETRGDNQTGARPVVYDTEAGQVLVRGDTGYYGNDAYGWAAFTAPATGRYYVLITNLDDYGYRTRWGEYMNYALRVSACQPDAYEQDDADRGAGKPIAVGDSQARNHCEDGVDWAVLSLAAPGSYTVSTGGLGPTADTALEIHTATSTSALASNDNLSVNNKASSVTYTFATAGTYYIKVLGRMRGAGSEYTLSVQPAKGRK